MHFTIWRHHFFQAASTSLELVRAPLLDGDLLAVLEVQVQGGRGAGHVEGHAVELGQDGELVRAYLVGRVPVADDAVGAHNDGMDFLRGIIRT